MWKFPVTMVLGAMVSLFIVVNLLSPSSTYQKDKKAFLERNNCKLVKIEEGIGTFDMNSLYYDCDGIAYIDRVGNKTFRKHIIEMGIKND